MYAFPIDLENENDAVERFQDFVIFRLSVLQ